MATKKLSSWDTYVKEASHSLELPVSKTETLTIESPTTSALKAFNVALAAGDEMAMINALVGDENAARLLELAEDKPAGALDGVIRDVLRGFGLDPNHPGE